MALCISVICMELLSSSLKSLINQTYSNEEYELMVSIMQLQTLLSESEVEIIDDELHIIHNHENYIIFEHNNRLVKKEGYQILMNDVKDITFSFDDEILIMKFTRHDKEYAYGIYKKEWWRD